MLHHFKGNTDRRDAGARSTGSVCAGFQPGRPAQEGFLEVVLTLGKGLRCAHQRFLFLDAWVFMIQLAVPRLNLQEWFVSICRL